MTTPRKRPFFLPARFFLLILLSLLLFSAVDRRTFPVASASPAPQKQKPKKDYALIAGTVWGPDDRPVYGVKVKIRRAKDKKPKWELVSDHAGEFAQRVPVGNAEYVIWADLKDFKPADGQPLHLAKEVTIHVYFDERVDTGLHLTR